MTRLEQRADISWRVEAPPSRPFPTRRLLTTLGAVAAREAKRVANESEGHPSWSCRVVRRKLATRLGKRLLLLVDRLATAACTIV